MALLRELLSDWVGLLSLATVVAAIGIIAYIIGYVFRRASK
jgi:hypothetical protein